MYQALLSSQKRLWYEASHVMGLALPRNHLLLRFSREKIVLNPPFCTIMYVEHKIHKIFIFLLYYSYLVEIFGKVKKMAPSELTGRNHL